MLQISHLLRRGSNERADRLSIRKIFRELSHAKKFGLEKIELHVYTTNPAGIALYKKFGFEEEGLIKKYRKLDGRYFDALAMGLFL